MSMTNEQRQEVKARLEAIEAEKDGRLTPNAVLEDAAERDSPLHDFFEWDDSKAGHAYRLDQARTLIKSVMVVVVTETKRVTSVAYVRDPTAPSDVQGYVSVAKLRSDPELARAAIIAEFARVTAMLERARALAIVLGAEDKVQAIIDEVVGLKQQFQAPEARQ